ncbi:MULTISPECIES: hypothetical protein [unclassified Polaribacter]|uniref:hypothetical protein n=1 Tax=unclassified Polaribacter TaxID=196858 RepID=UPI0011BE19BA|nr:MULTISPECIES: hypothetical protein [unclassified Polaribacter]TXD51186.1 hypothetical protein ES043_13025 [Polaribacter sp. IC063]TXD59091.1 hypothetical protein ES044_10680 [Polaribacter sp. IC066]
MRKLASVITIIAISLATTFSTAAAEKESLKITKKLRTEIISMLGDKIPIVLTKTSSAEVSFVINAKNEIVILSVNSNVNELGAYIKNKLNYKKIKVRGTFKGEIYKMPLKINME